MVSRWEVNEFDEVVSAVRASEVTRALPDGQSALALKEWLEYDLNGRLVGIKVENRGGAAEGAGETLDLVILRDILGNPVAVSREIDATTWDTTRYRYQAPDLLTSITYPEGNEATFVHDELNLVGGEPIQKSLVAGVMFIEGERLPDGAAAAVCAGGCAGCARLDCVRGIVPRRLRGAGRGGRCVRAGGGA